MQRATGKILPALANRPEIPIELIYLWEAFWILNGSRQIGFGTGPIPLTEISAYCHLFNVSDVQFFVACIRAMDGQYLAHKSEEAESESAGRKRSK